MNRAPRFPPIQAACWRWLVEEWNWPAAGLVAAALITGLLPAVFAIETAAYVDFKVKFNAAVADPRDEAKRNAARLAFEEFRRGFTGRVVEQLHSESWDCEAIENFLSNGQFLVPGNAEAEQKVLKMAILRAFVQVFGQREIRLKAQVAKDNLKEICEQSQGVAEALGEALG